MSEESLKFDHFFISYEIIYLLECILKYEKNSFSELICKAFYKDFQNEFKDLNLSELDSEYFCENDLELNGDCSKIVKDFFDFLESKISDVFYFEKNSDILNSDFFNKIDSSFNFQDVKEEYFSRFRKNGELKKEDFFKDILKKWNPKKEIIN